jgi:glycosyltransferase involved in cell wall biosynthesis
MKIEESIVIPFYNEQDNVEYVLKDLVKELKNNNYEIIAVDNNSIDNTAEIIKNISKTYKTVKYCYIKEKGYGNAIIGGLRQCSGDYLGYGWGDGQMSGKDVAKVFDTIKKEKLDLCKVKRINRKDSSFRKIQSYGYNIFYRILFPYIKFELLGDINGCPKIMNRNTYEKLNISSKRWFIDTEIMIKAYKNKLKIKEIPTEFEKRKGGKSSLNLKVIIEFIKEAIKYKMNGY